MTIMNIRANIKKCAVGLAVTWVVLGTAAISHAADTCTVAMRSYCWTTQAHVYGDQVKCSQATDADISPINDVNGIPDGGTSDEEGIYYEWDNSFMSLDALSGVENLFLKFYGSKKYSLTGLNSIPNLGAQCDDDQSLELVFTRL